PGLAIHRPSDQGQGRIRQPQRPCPLRRGRRRPVDRRRGLLRPPDAGEGLRRRLARPLQPCHLLAGPRVRVCPAQGPAADRTRPAAM
ncbi:hypothetical protein H4R19_001359, partial [Coemansia spiralis]